MGTFDLTNREGQQLYKDLVTFLKPRPTDESTDYVPTPPMPPYGFQKHFEMHNGLYKVTKQDAFRNAAEKHSKDIQGQMSLADFNTLLSMVTATRRKSAEQNRSDMRQNRREYRARHGITHDEAVHMAAPYSSSCTNAENVAPGGNRSACGPAGHAEQRNAGGGNGIAANAAGPADQRTAVPVEQRNAVVGAMVNAGDSNVNATSDYLSDKDSDYKTDAGEDSIGDHDLTGFSSDCGLDKESTVAVVSNSQSNAQDGAKSQPAGSILANDFSKLSVGNNKQKHSSLQDVYIVNCNSMCLVAFELTGNIVCMDSHRVEVSDDGWHLEYSSEVPKYKLDVAAMFQTNPNEKDIHQMWIAKALQKNTHNHFSGLTVESRKHWGKIHSIELPFQAGKTLFNPKSKEVDGFVKKKSKYGHTIAIVCLKPKLKSPPPQVASAVGTMVIPSSVFDFLGGDESPLAIASRTVWESFDEQSFHVGNDNLSGMELDVQNKTTGDENRLREELAKCKKMVEEECTCAILNKNTAERLERELKQLKSSQNALDANCNQHQQDLDAKKERSKEASMQVERLQVELSSLKTLHQADQKCTSNKLHSERQPEAEQQQIYQAKMQVKNLQDELSNLQKLHRTKLEKSNSQLHHSASQLDAKRKRADEASTKVNCLQSELSNLQKLHQAKFNSQQECAMQQLEMEQKLAREASTQVENLKVELSTLQALHQAEVSAEKERNDHMYASMALEQRAKEDQHEKSLEKLKMEIEQQKATIHQIELQNESVVV